MLKEFRVKPPTVKAIQLAADYSRSDLDQIGKFVDSISVIAGGSLSLTVGERSLLMHPGNWLVIHESKKIQGSNNFALVAHPEVMSSDEFAVLYEG